MGHWFKQDDKQRFHAWVDEHHRALYRHALWMTGQAELAGELVQETFYQAWKSRRSLPEPGKVRAWLITILRRALYRELQQSARYEPLALRDELLVDEGTDVGGLLDLARGLQSLSAAQRELLLLFALHGYTYAQIGEQLEIPVGTVMSRLARSRAALRAALEREGDAGKVVPLVRHFSEKLGDQ